MNTDKSKIRLFYRIEGGVLDGTEIEPIMAFLEIRKWRDGNDMLCSECGKPIYATQPMVGTNTQAPKKRHCRHFLCSPNASITVIGNGKATVFKNETNI